MAARAISDTATLPLRITVLASATLLLTFLSFKYAPAPWLLAGLGWAIVVGLTARALQGEWPRAALYNIAAVLICLVAVEGYFWIDDRMHADRFVYSDGYNLRDEVLGTAPKKASSGRVQRFHGGDLIYDVVYTIDDRGLRVSPSLPEVESEACVLFFGDSFTLGEGVGDADAMPYLVALRSAGQARAFNFGFHGYGPHQMLAALESDLVGERVDCRPTQVVYQAIPQHVARASGLTSFGRHAPRYRLLDDGSVRLDGHFDDEERKADLNRSRIVKAVLAEAGWQLGKSAAYQRLLQREAAVTDDHVALFLAVVSQAQREARRRFPHSGFDVILWPVNAESLAKRLHEGLARRGIRVHAVADLLPGYRNDSSVYELHPRDRHPNALAHSILADYVLADILGIVANSGRSPLLHAIPASTPLTPGR